jgi:selenocysteine-specific elongation factor
VPRGRTVRVREVQVHGRTVDRADGGRTALNLAAIEAAELRRGDVLTSGTEVIASDRVLVSLRPSAGITALPGPGSRPRLHLATASVGATIGRRAREYAELVDGRRVVLLNLDRPIALAAGDRFALRHPSPPSAAGGGVVVDPSPPRGPSRRRLSGERLMKLVATDRPDPDARLDLHGAMNGRLAPDVARALETLAIASVEDGTRAEPTSAGLVLSALRSRLVGELRRLVHVDRAAAAGIVDALIGDLITRGALTRAGERVRPPGVDTGQPALRESMNRLELLLAVAAPPSLEEAARAAGCPPEGIRALESEQRIIRVEDNLAWATPVYEALTDRALQLAEDGPLTPAAYRDATGTSRRFVLAILEDLDRRQVLRRTPDGHVRGPRAPTRAAAGR